MRRYVFLLAGLTLLGLVAPTSAGVIVTGQVAVIMPPGGSGTVDFTVTTTGGDLLDTFGVKFLITTVSGTGQLRFINPQSDPQITNPGANAAYVFGTDSVNYQILPAPYSSIQTTTNPQDTYIGGDGTVSGTGYSGTNELLIRLEVQEFGVPNVGNTYMISLVSDANTFFNDPSFAPLSFTSTPALVQAVPEPSSVVLLSLGAAGLLVWVRRRRQKCKAAAMAS